MFLHVLLYATKQVAVDAIVNSHLEPRRNFVTVHRGKTALVCHCEHLT